MTETGSEAASGWFGWFPEVDPALLPTWGTVAIGVFVAYVAWRQWQTAKNKLAVDLFAQRFAAYSRLIEIGDGLIDATTVYLKDAPYAADPYENIPTKEWERALIPVKLLFGREVFVAADRIGPILDYAIALRGFNIASSRGEDTSNYDLIRPRMRRVPSDYAVARRDLDIVVERYLKLGAVGLLRPRSEFSRRDDRGRLRKLLAQSSNRYGDGWRSELLRSLRRLRRRFGQRDRP